MATSKQSALVPQDDVSQEHSPLLSPAADEDSGLFDAGAALSQSHHGSPTADGLQKSEATKSTWYLILLTMTIGGLQLAWAVEMSNGSPLLLDLGISKSTLAIVWLAGPVTGVLVHPYVGLKADQLRSRFGRRRPFIVGGAAATIISLLALAWNGRLVRGVIYLFGIDASNSSVATTRIIFAIIMVWVLDVSINTVQAAIRAFIVDNAPTHQQDAANAWATRLTGVGNIVLYLLGGLDLPKILPFLGDTQFKVLCIFASVGLSTTVAWSCIAISEKDTRDVRRPPVQDQGYFKIFKDLFIAVRHLPRQVRLICTVQLAAWIGWFPFLFYTSTYIAQIYLNVTLRNVPNPEPEQIADTVKRGTRYGSTALMIYAIVFLVTIVVLPWFIDSSSTRLSGTNVISTSWRSKIPSLRIPGLTLRRAWLLSHLMFAVLCFLTFFAQSVSTATALIALFGIPWSLTMWAPYALIAAEISKRERQGRIPSHTSDAASHDSQTGVILGIHNVSIAAPQIVAGLLSSAIFHALQKQRDAVGDDSIAWVLRFCGLAALLAAFLTTKVGEDEDA